MKIGYLGSGAWGFCLASLLQENGHDVTLWSIEEQLMNHLRSGKGHARLNNSIAPKGMKFTTDLDEALHDKDLIVESVTSAGFRPVLQEVLKRGPLKTPFVITSKGIEQGSGELLCEVAEELIGDKHLIAGLSGPTIAKEVDEKLPSSVVATAYDEEVMIMVRDAFCNERFRVYHNPDVKGVSFGGAMKNIIAIACGISDGLGFGQNTKAALMTRGLHEIRKLAVVKGCRPETLNGLSGMGDLCVTCLSVHSRNHQFGSLLAKNKSAEEAKKEIGMVVEGAYTAVSALELSKKHNIPIPISEGVHAIIYGGANPKDAVKTLLSRSIKEETL